MRLEDNDTLCNLQATSDRGVCTVRTHTRAMSLRPGGAATSTKPTSAARLDAVLRAGQSVALVTKARDQAEEDDVGSGLTKALKNTSLVPTGACLPRGFDPDYCAYDRYYAIGVALVSAVLGALVDADVPRLLLKSLTVKMGEALNDACYTPPTDTYSQWMGKDKPFDQLAGTERDAAKEKFSVLCQSLDAANERALYASVQPFDMEMNVYSPVSYEHDDLVRTKCDDINSKRSWMDTLGLGFQPTEYCQVHTERYEEEEDVKLKRAYAEAWKEATANNPMLRFEFLVRNLIRMVMLPGAVVGSFISADPKGDTYFRHRELSILNDKGKKPAHADNPSLNAERFVQDGIPGSHTPRNKREEQESKWRKEQSAKVRQPNWLYVGAMAAWTLKHVSRYMNEHALMIASFFRTNARRLGAGQAPMLDLVAFARQCREDIADGANPPPPPPPAYEEFNQAAVAAERRREDARKRTEERDPLMDGIDYPETYASASGAAPLRA